SKPATFLFLLLCSVVDTRGAAKIPILLQQEVGDLLRSAASPRIRAKRSTGGNDVRHARSRRGLAGCAGGALPDPRNVHQIELCDACLHCGAHAFAANATLR